ncbi:hypothetical protein JW977_03725 [Candidatus Falkowbacteria bacterium]|nr:hypothetical protein [Candidatus Falkowbacteria bacterium]
MFKFRGEKLKKAIITVLILLFIFTNFYGIFLIRVQESKAQWLVADLPLTLETVTFDIFVKVWDEIKAVFFKNVLGNLLNIIAQQTAVWIASGAKGQGPQWITDFDQFIEGYADAAIGDLIYTLVNSMTGLNICTLDPRIAINLALSIPMFPEYDYSYQPACSFTELRSHWEEIGKSQLITFNASIGEGGSFSQDTSRFGLAMSGDQTLQTWYDMEGDWPEKYVAGCPSEGSGGKMICSAPSIQTELQQLATQLNKDTQDLSSDTQLMTQNAGTETTVQLSVGSYRITPENIDLIRQAWLNKINPTISKLDSIKQVFGACKSVNAFELVGGQCKSILPRLGVTAPATILLTGGLEIYFKTEINNKAAYVESMANTGKSGYEYLKTQIQQNFNPDYFEGGAAYNWETVKDLVNPEANEFNAYEEMQRQMAEVGFEAFLNQRLQAMVNQGWKAATDTVAGFVRTPASLLNAKATEDLVPNDSAQTYTKSIIADALGVFLQTLWNEYMRRLLESLASPQQQYESKTALTEALREKEEEIMKKKEKEKEGEIYTTNLNMEAPLPISNPANPYEEEVITIEGVKRYIERLAAQFSVNYSYKDVDLLAEFQLMIKGKINPNIYNNVIDPNFAMAINDQMTIKEAIRKGKLVGSYRFAWGEKSYTGTYHLENIKKLRKARVLPLGFELAAELIRDCNYRYGLGEFYKQFQDLNVSSPRGGADDPYDKQRLNNCVFKPFLSEDENIRTYNAAMLTNVINATLADTVNGFYEVGDDGVCGTFDKNESPFCNLIDPNWVIKLPATRCLSSSNNEPYGEILQSSDVGTRYSRCTDFISCINDDGKGGCLEEQYGVCVKEKNTWQFATSNCPSQYSSCRTYTASTATGNTVISYLKNTLSGSDICGPDNAGCTWYATNKTIAGWQEQPRIYLNAYAETCDKTNEGCNEFFLYRDPAANLVSDSSFEYTAEQNFPQNWDLIIKETIGADYSLKTEADCLAVISSSTGCKQKNNCNYDEYCLDYKYDNKIECEANNGKWQESVCVGAIKAINIPADIDDCGNNGGTYQQYCYYSPLKYDGCMNPQLNFTDPVENETCIKNSGTWISECRKAGDIIPEATNQADCEAVGAGSIAGTWVTYCKNALIYDSTQSDCLSRNGQWLGHGPFSDYAHVSKDGINTQSGISKLIADLSKLSVNQELQLIFTSKLPETNDEEPKILTKPGDVYTATVYAKADQPIKPLKLNLIKRFSNTDVEVTSKDYDLGVDSYASFLQYYATLATNSSGTRLDVIINLPNQINTKVFIDNLTLALNSIDQIKTNNFYTTYTDYETNQKAYYKKPPENLNCRGYTVNDPPPVVPLSGPEATKENCLKAGGQFWDQDGYFLADKKNVCYKYAPDDPACIDYMKVCQPEEVGCQIFRPENKDPDIPGVVGIKDYCPEECVGYDQYKQDSTMYEPNPDPPYYNFIPATAKSCKLEEVGCSQFTNLDEVAAGGEGIYYFTYLKQCIKPNRGLGEKTFFSRHNTATGGPQVIKYDLQQEPITGAPKTIDGSTDCRGGESDLNCLEFFDAQGNTYYRDIRVTISVSDDCHPYRKTDSNQDNCLATNGRWGGCSDLTYVNQSECEAAGAIWSPGTDCIYDAIPSENMACRAEVNGCRAFIGNRGNNVYNQIFDSFEEGTTSSWEPVNLSLSSESVIVGEHSLFVPDGQISMRKNVEIGSGNMYTLSFWAKSEVLNQPITVKFSTAMAGKEFITKDSEKKVTLTPNWQNFTLGPIYIDWTETENNQLVFEDLGGRVYFDNILLKVVNNNVFVVKNSWVTPQSCDYHYIGEMLGCQAYTDVLNQKHYLKSFTSICRNSVVGCQLLVDTKNSTNPDIQEFNKDNTTDLDDYTVSKDEIVAFVLDNNFKCIEDNKGCQKLGRVSGTEFTDVYLKNNPDKYKNVPKAIMCNNESLGCIRLVNDLGGAEYYKIDPSKICSYGQNIINGEVVTGWFKSGSSIYGCNSLTDGINNTSKVECEGVGGETGYAWSDKYLQCTMPLTDIKNATICDSQNNEWTSANICLANPFNIYKVYEANKYRGYVGLCDRTYNGCTEFKDTNDNFVFNGSFETGLVQGALPNWSDVEPRSGEKQIVTDNVQQGNKAIKLLKTQLQGRYGINYLVPRLEGGRTYKISFYYVVPEAARGGGSNCQLPMASFSFEKVGNAVENMYSYNPESGWKRVDFLFNTPIEEPITNYNLTLYAPGSDDCLYSYVLYDLVEVKENTEDSYYIIDIGNSVDRKSCASVDWDTGCVQFQNTSTNNYEIIKVKRDRACDQWILCAEQDPVTSNCNKVELCSQESRGKCTLLSPQKDNVRYDLQGQPIIISRIFDSVKQNGYIYRFGAGEVSRITQWRAGDYSGYSISNRYPLEVEISPQKVSNEYVSFGSYPIENKYEAAEDPRFIEPICKVFPAEDSPLPFQLSKNTDFKNLQNLYSQDYDIGSIGNGCFYEKATATGAGGLNVYFPRDVINNTNNKMCTSPQESMGVLCESNDECRGRELTPSESGTCSSIGQVKEFVGIEGMCLEFDALSPIYGSINLGTLYEAANTEVAGRQAEQEQLAAKSLALDFKDYRPYACLTYFPFLIDTCKLHKSELTCKINPACAWSGTTCLIK